jgi:hypothetical protein
MSNKVSPRNKIIVEDIMAHFSPFLPITFLIVVVAKHHEILCLVEFYYWIGMSTMVMEVSICLSQIPEFCTSQYIAMTMAAFSQARKMPTIMWWELGKERDITLIFLGIR